MADLDLSVQVQVLVQKLDELTSLINKIESIGKTSQGAAPSINSIATSTQQLSSAAATANAALSKLQNNIRLSGQAAGAGQPFASASQGLSNLQQSAANAARGIQAVGGAAASTTKSTYLLNAATSVFVYSTLFNLLQKIEEIPSKFLAANDSLYRFERGLKQVIGSSSNVSDELQFVRQTADRIGVSIDSLAEEYLKLSAATKGSVLEGEQTKALFSALSNALSVVGASAVQTEGAFKAFTDMLSKGTLQAEEWKKQLGNALPGANKILERALKLVTGELEDMSKAGELLATEVIPKITRQLQIEFPKATENIQTFEGAWNRLNNAFSILAKTEIGKKIFGSVVETTDKATIGVDKLSIAAQALGVSLAATRLAFAKLVGATPDEIKRLQAEANKATEELERLRNAANKTGKATEDVGVAFKTADEELLQFQQTIANNKIQELPQNLRSAVVELERTGDAAEAAAEGLKKFINAPLKTAATENRFIEFASSLQAIGDKAKLIGKDIREDIGRPFEKLSDDTLIKFRTSANTALDDAARGSKTAQNAVEGLNTILDLVVREQLERLSVNSSEALDGISKKVRDGVKGIENLGVGIGKVGDRTKILGIEFNAAFKDIIDKAKTEQDFVALGNLLQNIANESKITKEHFVELKRQLDLKKQAESAKEYGDSITGVADKYKALLDGIRADAEVSNNLIVTKKTLLESEIETAKAKGEETKAYLKSVEVKKLDIDTIKAVISAKNSEIKITYDFLNQIKQLADADNKRNDVEKENIKIVEDRIKVLSSEKKVSEAQLKNLEAQLKLLKENSVNTQESSKTIKQSIDDVAESYDNALKSAKEFAAQRLKGAGTAEIDEQLEKLKRIPSSLEKIRIENELQTDRFAKNLKEQSRAAGDFITAFLQGWHARLAGWSEALGRTFNSTVLGIHNAREAITSLDDALRENEKQFAKINKDLITSDGFVLWANKIAAKSVELERVFLAQAQSVETLENRIASLTEKTSLSALELNELQSLADTATNQFDLLDKADLDNLQGSIDSANQKLLDLKNQALEAQQALEGIGDELKNQLDELAGRQDLIEQRRFEDQLKKIKELQAKAGKAAQEEAEDAIALANQVHAEKLKQIEERANKEKTSGGNVESAGRIPLNGGGGGGSGGNVPAPGVGGFGGVNITFNNPIGTRQFFEDATREFIVPALEEKNRRTR